MRSILFLLLTAIMATATNAQTLRLVPTESVTQPGACIADASKKYICYSLEYTPEVSGVLTSYTTAFFISCTSRGPAVAKNHSCSMNNNVNLVNGCSTNGTILVNCSGNTGTAGANQVTAGQPVIIHQICFTIPEGESITIREDPVTDLTTSIDMANGESKTEYPVFADMKIKKERTELIRPLWLDFKSVQAGHQISQLDWTTSVEAKCSHYVVERSANGADFAPLGSVQAAGLDRINSYQFLDKEALIGKNYYRLLQVATDGSVKYSPVRTVSFDEIPFTVTAAPNPADQFINVTIQSPDGHVRIQLLDPAGRLVIDEENTGRNLTNRLSVGKLPAGVYTLLVESGDGKFNEKISIVH